MSKWQTRREELKKKEFAAIINAHSLFCRAGNRAVSQSPGQRTMKSLPSLSVIILEAHFS
jgi:hypothetical protein